VASGTHLHGLGLFREKEQDECVAQKVKRLKIIDVCYVEDTYFVASAITDE
jgi:hypothetical protein